MELSYADAAHFAAVAHGKQTRKYSGLPYIIHPLAVARRVELYTSDTEVLVAAVLHDVVEDTSVTVDDIGTFFGARVAKLVEELTNPKHTGNRAERKAKNLARLAEASPHAMLIKMCDIYDNTLDLEKDDPSFARVYFAEKIQVLDAFLPKLDSYPDFHAFAWWLRMNLQKRAEDHGWILVNNGSEFIDNPGLI